LPSTDQFAEHFLQVGERLVACNLPPFDIERAKPSLGFHVVSLGVEPMNDGKSLLF
jgi:hypothetical protein